ncbi:MAG: hypothetical protein GXC73_18495 [Chitinophagaceae bacterium]|nr:hypothetical protein [Chitinophagaceae bacterium]
MRLLLKKQLQPKSAFLIDSAGALISALMLAFVLTGFADFFGMPKHILYLLACIAFFFAVYSFTCFLFNPKKPSAFLRFIASANLLYCMLSIWFIISFCHQLTVWGFLYFILEKLAILLLVFIELKTASQYAETDA